MARRTATQKGAAALGFVLLGALAYELMDYPGLLGKAQRATTKTFAAFDAGHVRHAAGWDFLFIGAYAGLFVYLFALIKHPKGLKGRHPAAWAGMALAVGGAAADAVENAFVFAAFPDNPGLLDEMRSVGLVKYSLLGAAALTLITLVLLRSWRQPQPIGHSTNTPPHLKKDAWVPPKKGAKKKVGVCLSGGGIRSAAFSLGALQALRKAGKLDQAEYLAAVSGGGYLAAGWALSQTEPPSADPKAPLPWDPGSPEERWFRDNSSYLIPDTKGGVAGLFRLLAGVAVNLVLVGLLLSAASRPVGWAMHGLHDEFRNKSDALIAKDAGADVAVVDVVPFGTVGTGEDEPPIIRYAVKLGSTDTASFYDPTKEERAFHTIGVLPLKDAYVDVQGGRLKLVSQPALKMATCNCALDGNTDIGRPALLSVKDDPVANNYAPVKDDFKVKQQPLVRIKAAGVLALKAPSYEGWMWEFVGGLAVAALLASLAVTVFRPRGQWGEILRALARALGGAALVAFLLVVALPWLVVWLPRALADIPGKTAQSVAGSSNIDYLVPGGGLLAVMLAAGRQYLAGAKGKSGSQPSLFAKVKARLTKQEKELKWYELSAAKVLVALASLAAAVVVFVNSLQFAAANGPKGKLMGLAHLAEDLPWWSFLPDAAEFGIMVGLLVLFALVADAHSWSLFPFYKERLSWAYLVERVAPDQAKSRRYNERVPFTKLTGSKGPQLVACCAVNLSETGVVPPGRRAASFTFSSTEIGGPLVGYAKPEDYERLPESRKRDVTVASAMAISGAAFSPAMGKTNLGPVGTVLALANLRLGVWLPHPDRARQKERAGKEWAPWRFRRPHWVWFLRELTNKYKFDRRYLYVSDGGHWDNLGLVELLRRGCTEIYCISGAGDRAESFGTIGEAIALAREELGVEIKLDPSDLRAPSKGNSPAPKRELLRKGAKDKAAAYAAAGAVRGTFAFTRSPGADEGVLHYVEADLTSTMPFDVHTFAETETDFPDDSTGDQVFNHRQFESYRALGRHQAEAALKLKPPEPEPSCLQKMQKKIKDKLC